MKTILKNFCARFSNELEPFLATLGPALTGLTELSREEDLSRLQGTLEKLQLMQDRASSLQEKLANQYAYLLIFGPLKSGKSTLMNAISGAYVSEVSSLPTYPALVYVKDGKQNHFQAVTYNDQVQEFPDSQQMKSTIQAEYSRLADAILEAEKSGKNFDPEVDLPSAIRRVDVEVPAANLSQSGTVLVDTPGLYSRMKFGYDRMTKDFRDTAACAIFVVKTDDLFFEKVFEEFEELLGYFSRIFLISNIDSSKQDLQPDGTLNESLEATDPAKVIEAFQSFSISAPLQQAITDGRLNIYSIDLLKAASRRLTTKPEELESADEDDDDDLSFANIGSLEAEADSAADGFDEFLDDLTSYLNGSDYLEDFMTDTVNMANELIQEEIQESAGQAIDELRGSHDELNANLAIARQRRGLLAELNKTDWLDCFAHLNKENEQLLQEFEQRLDGPGSDWESPIQEWMQSDESWRELLAKHINPLLKQRMTQEAQALVEQLRVMLDNATGGARFTFNQTENLAQAGIGIDTKVSQLLKGFAQNVEIPEPRLQLSLEDVPLRLGLVDKLFFRPIAMVRQHVFGTNGDQPVAASKKKKRLAGDGVETIRNSVSHYVNEKLPAFLQEYAHQVLNAYISQYCSHLKQECAELSGKITNEIHSLERKLNFCQEALEGLSGIKSAAQSFSAGLSQIETEFQPAMDSGAEFAIARDDHDPDVNNGSFDESTESTANDPEILDFDDTIEPGNDDYLARAQ